MMRIIGASCGAFVACFLSILASVALEIHGELAAVFWLAALICGAVVGSAFPRLGHASAYGFIIFLGVMLSLTLGRNPREQILLFAIFSGVELIFFLCRLVLSRPALPN